MLKQQIGVLKDEVRAALAQGAGTAEIAGMIGGNQVDGVPGRQNRHAQLLEQRRGKLRHAPARRMPAPARITGRSATQIRRNTSAANRSIRVHRRSIARIVRSQRAGSIIAA